MAKIVATDVIKLRVCSVCEKPLIFDYTANIMASLLSHVTHATSIELKNILVNRLGSIGH